MSARWLVPHDFSSFGDAALREAVLDLQGRKDGKLFLLHAVMLPLAGGIAFPDGVSGAVASQVDLRRHALLSAEKRLQKEKEKLLAEYDVDIEIIIAEGEPLDCILNAVKDHQCNRIILGSHGRKGLDRYLLGSVAEKAVRRADVPVLVVKMRHDSKN